MEPELGEAEMAGVESAEIDARLRMETFRFLDRNQHALETTQLTLLKLFQVVVSLAFAVAAGGNLADTISKGFADWGAWRWVLAALAGVAGLVVGFMLGALPFNFLERRLTRRLFRNVQATSNEDLWEIVDQGLWNFRYTLALLQLGARGQDVRRELATVLHFLVANNRLFRCYAWDALRLVFFDEAHVIADYNPKASLDDCCKKAARLLSAIPPKEKEAMLSSGEKPRKRLSAWHMILATDAAQLSCDKILACVSQRMPHPPEELQGKE
jgi:hypothetical protein